MKKKKNKKYAVTLIEIMIVILLIGLIGGTLAFNMRGSMDKGKLFKSEQNCMRVYDTLMMEYAKGERDLEQIVKDKEAILLKSPLVKDGAKALKDGWGDNLVVEIQGEEIFVYSSKARNMEANAPKAAH